MSGEPLTKEARELLMFRRSLAGPMGLVADSLQILALTSEPGQVSNIGKALWRLLDAAGQLAEICPREIYDPTQPTGMGFALAIHSRETEGT